MAAGTAIAATAVLLRALCAAATPPTFWDSTVVVLPHRYAGTVLRDALSGRERRVGADSLMPVSKVLADLPVALLE